MLLSENYSENEAQKYNYFYKRLFSIQMFQ